MEGQEELVVIDTDCGIDDAMAFLLALCDRKKCRILAVTCCFGNTILDNVCDNVKRVLTVCNEKNIPIYRGSYGPLLSRDDVIDTAHHADDGLGNVAHQFSTGGLSGCSEPAAAALVRLSIDHPLRIHLIAIGPLTNVALAHRLDPHFTQRLKSIYCMGGAYKCIGNRTEVAEYNFFCDPEAADIVLGEALCPLTLVPWETTLDYGIEWDIMDKLCKIQTEKGIFLQKITAYSNERSRKKGNPRCLDCDLLAVASLLYPECITSTLERPLAVESQGQYTRGMTILLRNAGKRKNVRIVTGFNQTILNKLRFKMLSADNDNSMIC